MYQISRSKQILYTLCIGCWIASSAIAGCAPSLQPDTTSQTASTPPASTAAPTPAGIPGVQQWTHLLKGESTQGLTFTPDGQLMAQEQVLLSEIPVSYVSDGSVIYAEQLLVSDPSPSGRFTIVKACEAAGEATGLCWSVFLVDHQAATAEKVEIAKYGGLNWVQWSADERYAVFAESMEGVTWFIVLDLETKAAKMFDQTETTADLGRFGWTSNRTFEAPLLCDSDCATSPFKGDITRVFSE